VNILPLAGGNLRRSSPSHLALVTPRIKDLPLLLFVVLWVNRGGSVEALLPARD
jgi:hypothetical protein